MNSIDGLKTCRKGLHQYPADKKQCPECKKASTQRWSEQNSEQKRKINQRWRERNCEKRRENKRRWRKENPEMVREANRRWYAKNATRSLKNNKRWREKNSEKRREKKRVWKKQNQDKVRADFNRYRAKKKQATPPWADHAAINAIYAEAVRLEKETGIKQHVDHIYPLNCPYMCGLHVAENLQILPGLKNCSKGNRTWPGQLECQRLPLHVNGFEVVD